MRHAGLILLLLALPCGCAGSGAAARITDSLPEKAQARSLLGKPLYPPPIEDQRRAELQEKLDAARAEYVEDPRDPDRLIWFGRRLAYLGLYQQAIHVFTEGIAKHRHDARMYRHRGHRFITLRRFDEAIRDLEYASRLIEEQPDQVEPDGLPNARNIPTGTLGSNIWYHLGLARYLSGEFEAAEQAYERCMAFSDNPDMLCATSYWLVLARMRLGKDAAAKRVLEPIHADLDVIENHAYHRLLLLYKGALDLAELEQQTDPDAVQNATLAYGLARHELHQGRSEAGANRLSAILEQPMWAAFGYIAAEADVAR